MRWLWRFFALCGFVLAAMGVYAHYDHPFADRVYQIRRDYHYANGLTLSCDVSGPCTRLAWDLRAAGDKSAEAFALNLPDGLLTAQDLSDAKALRVRGWQIWSTDAGFYVGDPDDLSARGIEMPQPAIDAGALELQIGPSDGVAQPFVRTRFVDGVLGNVRVRSTQRLVIIIQGKPYAFPVPRTKVMELWGSPLSIEEHRAIKSIL